MDLDLAQLRAFAAAVDAGTFESAARHLHVTPSAISQRIKALEIAAGRVLLQRTKPVTVTESGQVVLRLARQIEALSSEASERLDEDESATTRKRIAVAINADSLSTWVMPALAEMRDVASFEIFREDEERTVALLREGRVMAAVTAESQPVQGCTSTRLGRMQYRPMATTEFIAKWFPDGPTANTFASAPGVMFDRSDPLQDRFVRRHVRRHVTSPRHYVPSSVDFTEAIRHGLGWGLVPHLMGGQYERSGELVNFNPGEVLDVTLYWQQWKLSSLALEQLTTAVRKHAKAKLL